MNRRSVFRGFLGLLMAPFAAKAVKKDMVPFSGVLDVLRAMSKAVEGMSGLDRVPLKFPLEMEEWMQKNRVVVIASTQDQAEARRITELEIAKYPKTPWREFNIRYLTQARLTILPGEADREELWRVRVKTHSYWYAWLAWRDVALPLFEKAAKRQSHDRVLRWMIDRFTGAKDHRDLAQFGMAIYDYSIIVRTSGFINMQLGNMYCIPEPPEYFPVNPWNGPIRSWGLSISGLP